MRKGTTGGTGPKFRQVLPGPPPGPVANLGRVFESERRR
jgi:hypothetical protein